MAANLANVVSYYCDLLLLQYKWQIRARANIAIYSKQAVGDLVIQDIDDAFNINTAIGVQLDTLGKYVGVPRNSGPPEDLPYYGFWDYLVTVPSEQNTNGFRDYTDTAINASAVFYNYSDYGTRNTDLTDAAYRLLIQLKIILNSNNGTLASIQDYLHTFFPGLVALTDNADMTMTYTIQEGTPLPTATLEAYLPKPMGVGLNFVTMAATFSSATLTKTVTGSAASTTITTTTPISVTITNGVGPYSYNWQLLTTSGATEGYVTSVVNQGESPTNFFRIALLDTTNITTWRCVVTDSRGLTAIASPLTVTLAYLSPP
jgi:hypothetical protein